MCNLNAFTLAEGTSFKGVLSKYLRDLSTGINDMTKFYLLDWAFSQFEAMEDFVPYIKESESGNLQVETCEKECYKKMLIDSFDHD